MVAIGTAVGVALEAAPRLGAEGTLTAVVDLGTLLRFDEGPLVAAAKNVRPVTTFEEHSIIGAFGSAVCETLSRHWPTPVNRCGISDRRGESGKCAENVARAGLDVPVACRAAREALKRERNR